MTEDEGAGGQIWLVGCSCVGVLGIALLGLVAVGVAWWRQPPADKDPAPIADGAPTNEGEGAGGYDAGEASADARGAWVAQVQEGETCAVEYLPPGEAPRVLHRLAGPCPGWSGPPGMYAENLGRAFLELGPELLLMDLAAGRTRVIPLVGYDAVTRLWFHPAGDLLASSTIDVPARDLGELGTEWAYGGRVYAAAPSGRRFTRPALCQTWAEVGGVWLPREVVPWDEGGAPPIPCASMAQEHEAGEHEDGEEPTLDVASDYPNLDWDDTPLPTLDAALLPGADTTATHVVLAAGGTRYAFASDPTTGPGRTPLWFEATAGHWETVEGFATPGASLDAGTSQGELAACIDGKAAILVAGHARWSGSVCPIPWWLPAPASVAAPYGDGITNVGDVTTAAVAPSAWWVAEPIAEGCRLARWSAGERTDAIVLDTGCTGPQVARTDAGTWIAVGSRLVRDGALEAAPEGTLSLAMDTGGTVWVLGERAEGRVTFVAPDGAVTVSSEGTWTCSLSRVDGAALVAEAPAATPCAEVAAARGLTPVTPGPTSAEGARWSWRDVVSAAVDGGQARAPVEVDGEVLRRFAPDGAPLVTTEQGDQLLVCGPDGAILVDGPRRRVVAAFRACPSP